MEGCEGANTLGNGAELVVAEVQVANGSGYGIRRHSGELVV